MGGARPAAMGPQNPRFQDSVGLLSQWLHARKRIFDMNFVFDSVKWLGAVPMDPRLDEVGSCWLV